MTATIELSTANDGTITAVATAQGGQAPVTFSGWAFPSDATNISGSGNTRTFKSNGGDVSVTATDTGTPTPCSANATAHICSLGVALILSDQSDLNNPINGAYYSDFITEVQPTLGTPPYLVAWSGPPGSINTTEGQIGSGTPLRANASYRVPTPETDTTISASVTITDSATPPCSKTITQTKAFYARPPIEPPTGCPAGQHDDGTGNCVTDGNPQPCAAGYQWNGTACVPIAPPPTPTCTVNCSFKSTDKGANLYRIEAVPTGAQNPPVTAAWKRDGAALASTALFIEETIEPNAEAIFSCTLTDGACTVTRSHVQRNEDGGTTVIAPDAIPAKPDAPTATNLHVTLADNGLVTLSFVTWPANTRTLKLYRDGAEIHSWMESDTPRSFEVKGLQFFQIYAFTLRGYNLSLAGPVSNTTNVDVKSGSLQVAWIKPATGAEIKGKTALVGRVGASGTNVQMLFNGAPLSGVHRASYEAGGVQLWGANFNPLGLDFLGNITLRLLAFDAQGLPAFADIAAYLAITLAKSTRYEHIAWADPNGRNLGKVALTTLLDEGDGWVDALVTALGAGVALPYDDYSAMEELLRDWQSVALDEVFAPLSDAATPSLEVVLRLTPPNLETRYPLGATGATRVRRIDDETLEVLTFEHSRVVEVTPDGVEEIFDISARGFANVIDARRWRDDKVIVVTQDEVWVCERDASAADWRVILGGESKPCVAVESLGDEFYLAFADATGSRVWKHDGTDPVKVYETTEQTVLMRANADTLAWATATNQLWSFKAGVAAKIFDHNAPVVDILFGEPGVVAAFADAANAWKLSGEGAATRRVLVGQVAPNVRALGFCKGKNALPRLTVGGGASAAIYSVAPSGAWGGIWTLAHGATGIDGLGRFLITHVQPEGDPLMGGKPAVTSEILVAIARATGGGGYVAFIEEAKQTRDTSTRARGVKRLVVVHENKGETEL